MNKIATKVLVTLTGLVVYSTNVLAQTAVFTNVSSTGDAFILDRALPNSTVMAILRSQVVVNKEENTPSVSKKGKPIVTMRGIRLLNAPNRPTSGYLIAEQVGESMATITLYNNGSGTARSHAYDCESKVSLVRPSSLTSDLKSMYTGTKWKYRKHITGLTWSYYPNFGFDDYEATVPVTFTLPHELSASAKVTGPRSGKDGNFGEGWADVVLDAKFVTNLPSATIHVGLNGSTLGSRSIRCIVTTLATDAVEYLIPDTDGGITLIAFADEYSSGSVKVSISGSLVRAGTVGLDDGGDVSMSVTPIFGDVNGDNTIDSLDLALMNQRISSGPSAEFLPDEFFDYNQDGLVNSTDLAILVANFGLSGD